jgi:hypothetical protein
VEAEQRFQLVLQAAQIKQCCTRQRIDQQIDVAAIAVGAMQHRTERVGSRCGNGLPLHALRFASCQAQQTVAWASFLIETR